MKSKRVSSNKYGTIYKLENPLILSINNTKTIFGIESAGKYGEYIKWNIDDVDSALSDFELHLKELKNSLPVKSSIVRRDNYPLMIQTKIPNNKNLDIIRNELGDITTVHQFINKNSIYNILLEISGYFVSNKEIKYTVYLKKIELRSKN